MGQYAFDALLSAGRSAPAEPYRRLHGHLQLLFVLPQIIASLAFGWIMLHVLHNNRMAAVTAGGVFLAWPPS
jgi:hypothetical protein